MIILSIIDKKRQFLVYPLSIKLSRIRPIAKIYQKIPKYTKDQKIPTNLPKCSPILRLWYFLKAQLYAECMQTERMKQHKWKIRLCVNILKPTFL